MKKYKLIKAYPNSEAIGTVFTADNEINAVFRAENDSIVDYITIQNFKDFFEEVIEPNYLITAFKSCPSNDIYKLQPNGKYAHPNGNEYHFDTMFTVEMFSVYSIKSELGKEFIIGNNVSGEGEDFVIESFELGHHILGGCYACGKNNRGKVKVSINLLSVVYKPKPIFISADGKEMFEGDCVYHLCSEAETSISISVVKRDNMYGSLRFSNRLLAQEYIGNNKPKYSLIDIEKVLNKKLITNGNNFYLIADEFKKLGK